MGGQAEASREGPGAAGDSIGVLAGVVVAVLGCDREVVKNLLARPGEFFGAACDALSQLGVAGDQLGLEHAGHEGVSHAQLDFLRIQRLDDEVTRAERQRPVVSNLVVGLIGHGDDDLQAAPLPPRAEALDHRQRVHVGQREVEQVKIDPSM